MAAEVRRLPPEKNEKLPCVRPWVRSLASPFMAPPTARGKEEERVESREEADQLPDLDGGAMAAGVAVAG